jgi:hypothetical protein
VQRATSKASLPRSIRRDLGALEIGMLSAQHPPLHIELKLFNWTKIPVESTHERPIDLAGEIEAGAIAGALNM